MKRFILLLFVVCSVNLQAQFNSFFWAHSSASSCRPTGLITIDFGSYMDDYNFTGSFQNAHDAFYGFVMGEYTEEYVEYSEARGINYGDTVWYGIGTSCDYLANGYYLTEYGNVWYRQRIIDVYNSKIRQISGPLGSSGNGYLYNWFAINGDTNGDGVKEKEIAPTGWHVPSRAEWDELITAVSNSAKSICTTTNWSYSVFSGAPGNDPSTNNSTGFSATPSGARSHNSNTFKYITEEGLYHTTYLSGSITLVKFLEAYNPTIREVGMYTYQGASLRLIKDDATLVSTVTDYDGNVYSCVKIGNQVWTTSNFKCRYYNDGTSIPEEQDQTTWDALTTGARCVYMNYSASK